jgi:uncharacterized RDD family membrane protein YckC
MAKLIINPTSSSKREIGLARTVISIGRDPSNDVVLPDAMVSRRHAVIEYRGSQYYLRDCNSSNGSLVNGDRVSERSLRDGDLVAIGTARLLFRDDLPLEDPGAKVVQHPSAPKLQCPSCQADYRKGDLFCRQCGTPIAPPKEPPRAVCTSCGTAVPLPAKFCNACGSALARDLVAELPAPPEAAEPEPEPEHRAPEEAAASRASAEPAPDPVPNAVPDPAPADAPRAEEPVAKQEATIPPPPPARPPEIPRPSRSGAIAEPTVLPEPEPVEVPRPASSPALVVPAAAAPAAVPPKAWPSSRPSRPERAVDKRSDPRIAAMAPADLGSRFLAGLIDALIVNVGLAVVLAPGGYYWWTHEWPRAAAEVSYLPILLSVLMVPLAGGLSALYYVYYWGTKGATPGKAMMGLSVQALDGTQPIGISRAGVRFLGYLLSGVLLGIGFLMILFGGNGLHDRIAGTRVVRSRRD